MMLFQKAGKSPAIFLQASDSLHFDLWNHLDPGSSSHWKTPILLGFLRQQHLQRGQDTVEQVKLKPQLLSLVVFVMMVSHQSNP